MVDERVRYRLSVTHDLNERMTKLADLYGLQVQQMAYMCMGAGLQTLESLSQGVQLIAHNPELLASIMAAQKPQTDATADAIMTGLEEQKKT